MAWRGGLGALAAALWVLTALGQRTALAAAPSFDCAAATAPIELLICGHDDLAQADAELATLFRRVQGMPAASPDLLAGQRLWLKSRLATCDIPARGSAAPEDPATARCLLALYRDRIAVLTGLAADKQASAAPPVTQAQPAEPSLDPRTLPATGERSAILSIAEFGRYSIVVKSAQGVALQLVDRMTGPGDVQGAAGESDGRIDAFLDRGQYKILLRAAEQGSGDAVLSARRFAELNGPKIPRLPEIRRVDTTLDDYQQRSYWLEIKERRLVAIEAAGRNLADLRLWRDGAWLVDAAPSAAELDPLPGKKLAVRRIVATLEPGLYRLSAYGGVGETWATSSEEHPLHLRMGIPTLADAGRETFTASPFGIDRYLVPGEATFFRLELPVAEAAALSVEKYNEQQPFHQGGSAAITKKSLPPVAQLHGAEEAGYKLVTVTREAGKPYVLQQFQSVSDYRFDGTGDYWLGTLQAGNGEDDIDATGVLTRRTKDAPDQIIRSNAPRLDAGAVWSGRFNLLDVATVFFQVTRTGRYVAAGSGVEAVYRFEPIVPAGTGYKAPDFQPSGHPWALDPGYYVLTVKPGAAGKGILDLRVAAEGVTGDGGDQAKETAVQFPAIHLDSGARYTLHRNDQPGVRAGVVLRRLPVDLRPGLPVTVKAGQSLDVPVTAPGDGLVAAIAEDGQALGFAIDHHGAPLTKWRNSGGRHVLTLANPTSKALAAALRFTPDALTPDAPLPAVSPEALKAVPDFPALAAQQPRYFDIEPGEQRTFALDVDEPGLYRVESSGLLQTEGVMRTRTVVSLDSQANNGTGRNFLLQQYLGQGSYQVSVAAQGETHGHMGVAATRTVLMEGGALSLGIAARNTILAGNGLSYSFAIPVAGRYRLQALGLGRTYQMRLEDADGWPIVAPNAPADLTQDFAAGRYRLVILPQPVDARIVTLLAPVVDPAPLEGHGPHDLALNRAQSYRWEEPAPGGTRTPDQWRFQLPAAAHLAIDFGRGMVADLVAPDGRAIERIEGGEAWKGELPAGSYVLRAMTREPNNRFDYTVDVAATELLAGKSRVATLPADIPVSLGSDGVAEIASFGTVDVRAWLFDQKGHLVASNDDRPNDWNFAIAGRMRPGYYRLHVETVGSGGATAAPAASDAAPGEGNDQAGTEGTGGGEATADQPSSDAASQPAKTTISIYQAAEQQEPALAPGDTVLAGPNTHLVPLVAAAGDLLVVSADGDGPAVGLGIEVEENGAWRTLAEKAGRTPWVAVPGAGIAGPRRLRVWSVDRSTAPIRLQTRMVELQPAPAADLVGAGVPLRPVPGIEPPLGAVAVEIEAAGALHLRPALPDLAWSTQKGRALAADSAGVVFGDKGRLWFGARLADSASLVAATRVVPTDEAVALTLPGSDRGAAIIADPAAAAGGPHLWLVESRLGDPGIGAGGLISAPSAGSAVAIAADPVPSDLGLRLWNAGDPQAPLPVTLRRIGFPAPVEEALDWGVADRRIGGRQALAFALPQGLKRLRLALPPETAVVLRGAGGTGEAIWSGRAALALSRDSDADRLLVLSTAGTDGELGLALVPLGADAATTLGSGRIFKQYFAAAGVTRLDVRLSATEKQAAGRLRLMLAGAVQQATLLRDDGTLSRDAEPILTGDARVDIAHGAGLVVGWIDGGDPLLSQDVATEAVPLRTTSVLPLHGAVQQVDVSVDAPTFLHLRTTTPVIVQLPPAAGAQPLRLFANGADLGLLLPTGTTPIVLRAAGEGDLAGLAEATLIDITPIGEGLGPAVRLAPGESRLYSFAVPDERDIGVGVRDTTDSARCRVLDAAGTVIGAGVVQLLHLKAGTYLLAVDAPADGNAIAIQPALVGIATPDGSPPDEVKRGYLDLAGLKQENPP